MTYKFNVDEQPGIVRAVIAGEGPVDEFISVIRSIGAQSVKWAAQCLLVDMRGAETEFTFTEQLLIGRAVGVNMRHLQRHAALVRAARITHVGEKAARDEGARVRVFATEAEALRWLLAPEQST